MAYYKTNRKSNTPISDAAIFFSKHENYKKVFDKETDIDESKSNTSIHLMKVKEILLK